MDTDWLLIILAGAAAGWTADWLVPGVKVGWSGAMLAGVLGGILGGWLFDILGIGAGGVTGRLIASAVGAVIVLLIYRILKRR